MKLRTLLILLFLLASISSSFIAGLLYYYFNSEISLDNSLHNLSAVAESRSKHVETYFKLELDKVKIMSNNTEISIIFEKYLKTFSPELKEAIRGRLDNYKNSVADYRHICLLDLNGRAVVCDSSSLEGEDFSQEDFFVESKTKEGAYFYDHKNASHSDIVGAGPIKLAGKLIGVFTTFQSFGELDSIISNRTNLGETGEIIVGYLNDKNQQIIYPFSRLYQSQINGVKSLDILMMPVLFGNVLTSVDVLDYRNVPVVLVSRYIGISDLGLISKIDSSEIIGQYKKVLIKNSIIFVFLGLLGSSVIGFFLAFSISNPLNKLKKGVEIISGGNLGFKINLKTVGEINSVAEAFNNMSAKLKKSYESLKDEKTQDEAVLASIGDGVFVLDIEERVILFNSAMEKISGFPAKEILGKKYTDKIKFISEKNGIIDNKFIIDSLRAGLLTQMSSDVVLVRKDGTEVAVSGSASPIKDKNGKIFGCVIIVRDSTKEREINKLKSEFVSVASHQLRTPLTGIKWFTEFLLKGGLDAKSKDYVQQIYISNERMLRLVDDLLNVSHIETGNKFEIVLKDADLILIIKDVIKECALLAKPKYISLVYSEKSLQKLILAIDELKLRQVFQNLISNAIKYSKENTKIMVECQIKNNEVIFSVRDKGIGIPEHQQGQVFSKFFRAENVFTMHTDGTGLGLYIAKAIVDAHGGKIWFKSEENKGTVFFISLPNKIKLIK